MPSARKARRHRLQLLHRAPGSGAAAGSGSGFGTPPSAGGSGGKLQHGRRSPPSSGPHRGAPGQGMSPRVGSRPGSGRLASGAAGGGRGSPTLAGGQWVLPVSRGKVVTAAPAASPEAAEGQKWLLLQQQQGPARALDLPPASEEVGPTEDGVSAAVHPTQQQAASHPLQQAEQAAAGTGPLIAAAGPTVGATSEQDVTGGLRHPLSDVPLTASDLVVQGDGQRQAAFAEQDRSKAKLPTLGAAPDLKDELQLGPGTEQIAAPAEDASCGQRPGGPTVEPGALSTSQLSQESTPQPVAQASTQQRAAGASGEARVATPVRAGPPEVSSAGSMPPPAVQQQHQQTATAQDSRGPGPAAPAVPAARRLLHPSPGPDAASSVTARASGDGSAAAAPGRSFSLPRRTPAVTAGAAPLAKVLSGRSAAAPLPPPPPPPPPPVGLGGLRVKSAAFRKVSFLSYHCGNIAAAFVLPHSAFRHSTGTVLCRQACPASVISVTTAQHMWPHTDRLLARLLSAPLPRRLPATRTPPSPPRWAQQPPGQPYPTTAPPPAVTSLLPPCQASRCPFPRPLQRPSQTLTTPTTLP